MLHDISEPDHVKKLVDHFYDKVRQDDLIGFIFNEAVPVNWPEHLPKMYAFWEFILLGAAPFQGNPIEKHYEVHQKVPLLPEHFERWLLLFQSAVDDLFSGPKADEAKFRAFSIAEIWKGKFR
ncbi:MAG: group III truncated hemoglobin [Lewinellaceae bacterium]|nr:group III truncated hemoglobin [Lewinellaceae bacterium]